MDGVESLWNSSVSPTNYDSAGEKYQAAILEQYRIYVEIFDRVGARRWAANTFFLTLNSAVITVVGIFWKGGTAASPWLLLPALIIVLGQCFAWYQLVHGYRTIGSTKFRVIGALEERLPASVFWRAEWNLWPGRATKRRGYHPIIVRWETSIPVLFAAAYVFGFVMALALS